MQGLSPLAMLLSGLGQRDDVVTGTDNQGNLVVMPKPGATPKLPGGVGTAPVAAPPQAAPVMPTGQNPYVAAAQPAPAMMPGAAAASPAAMPSAAAPSATPATPTVNAPAAPQYSALPTPPTYAPTDMARRQALEASIAKDSKPTDPNDPAAKTHWYDRLLGGLVGFGRGYVHDPNAIAEGGAVTNRRFNTAEGLRERRLSGDQSALENFDKGESVRQRDFNSQNDVFEDEMKRVQEERQQFDTSSKAQERGAKADKYDNAIDPQSVGKGDDGKWYGTTYGGTKKEVPEPKYAQQADNRVPSGYENGVYQEELAKTPNDRAGALHRANQRIESTETKKFNYKNGNGGNNETPATKLRRSMQINKANSDRQTQLRTLEKGDPAKGQMGYQQVLAQINKNPKLTPEQRNEQTMRLNEAHAQEKQQVEDQYAETLHSLGQDYNKVQYKPDGSFTREGESANTPAKGGTTEEGRVRVKDKSGKLFTVPQSQLSKALKQGYTKE